MLILDLDNTIFETKTINPEIFDGCISALKKCYAQEPEVKIEPIIYELWTYPIDVVLSKYQIPNSVTEEIYSVISNLDYRTLNINPYRDYEVINSIKMTKILVTTGLRELQLAKISALGIKNDFESILIDDPRISPRNSKFNIFSSILKKSNLSPESIWVIGDNPNSEIKAAHSLGMKTIQRLSYTKEESEIADYKINTFDELPYILNGK